jgi:biotin carboxylase
MRPRVAVLHHALSFFPLDLYQQVGEQVELLWVVDAECAKDEKSARMLGRLGTVVDIAHLNLDQAAARLAEHRPDGIVSFVDDHLETAAALAQRLELPYHTPEAAAVMVDKRRQRTALERAGIPGPDFWPVPAGITMREAADLAELINYPAVFKPAEGSGSRGIYVLETASDFLTAMRGEAAVAGCVVEQYLYDDPAQDPRFASYFSLESVVSAGRTSHVALTGRFPIAQPFRETGNFIPGILAPELHQPVLAMVDQAIEALDIRTAVIHTEIKLTPDGPRLIEVNGRLGGRPPFVLHSVSDLNLFTVSCQVATGVPVSYPDFAECRGVGFWLMLQPPMSARRVASLEGLTELSVLPGVDLVNVHRNPGESVDWMDGTSSRVVTVRGTVPDHEVLADLVESIESRVDITYDG